MRDDWTPSAQRSRSSVSWRKWRTGRTTKVSSFCTSLNSYLWPVLSWPQSQNGQDDHGLFGHIFEQSGGEMPHRCWSGAGLVPGNTKHLDTWATSAISTSLPKSLPVASCFHPFISSGVASLRTNEFTTIITFYSSMKSRIGPSTTFQHSPPKNGGPFLEIHTGRSSGPSMTHVIHWHLTLTCSGSMAAHSFSAVCGVLMSLRGIITPQVNCLAVAMSSFPQQMTSTFTR